jgi:TolB-like protein/DNA-binding winged helix-turn-helix (wHTH) protein/Flp pilus assembly protein TadD
VANEARPQRGAQKPSAFLNGPDCASNPVRYYEFERFRLDAKRRLLTRDGEPVAIKPKAFDTLLLLVRHRDRLLEKEELMTRLWPDTIVEEANLTQNVFVVRKALGEAPGEQRFIATVARQGYRFVGDVQERRDEPAPGEAGPLASAGDAAQASAADAADVASPATAASAGADASVHAALGSSRRSRIVYVAGAALTLTVVVIVGAMLWRQRASGGTGSAGMVRSIAVLPFRNSSGDPADEYFADGVTEAITTDLASISALRVISRQSVARFKSSVQPMPDIARLLGVDALIQGAVARGSERIRVTVQLVEGRSDHHLWAETYDRDLGDVLAVQGQIAHAVAAAIRVHVTDQERAGLADRRPVDPEAYALYLRGKHFLHQRSDNALRRSVELYQQAIARDNTFAAAYGDLAVAYALLGPTMTPQARSGRVEAAAQAALALDPRQPDARAALAAVGVINDGGPNRVALIEAVARDNPNHMLAQLWYGTALIENCRFEEGMAQRRLAVQLDPLSTVSHVSLGLQLARHRRYQEALASLNQALELDPNNADAHGALGWIYLQQGKQQAAIEELETCARLSSNSPRTIARLAHGYGLVGRTDDARRLLRSLEERARTEYIAPVFFVHVLAGLGERDRAFAKLDEVVAAGRGIILNVDPLLAPLYSDPRFAELGRRVKKVAPCPSP